MSMMMSSTTTPSASSLSALEQQKENQKNQYAERVKNSPGWRRRYGVESPANQYNNNFNNNNNNQYNNNYSKRGGNASNTNSMNHHPPQPVPKVRLPLPKNAVLLSLIQASEPARRRAEVEAPSTPQKAHDDSLMSPPRLSFSAAGGIGNTNSQSGGGGLVLAGSGSGSGGGGGGSGGALPQFSRPSPLFLDKSHSSDQHDSFLGGGTGSGGGGGGFVIDNSADDEEHKIRVGTYLEGGPCGTYAVAVKTGLLVYPTLFEHTLPSALSGLRGRGVVGGNGGGGGAGDSSGGVGRSLEEEEIDVMKRDVEQVVKNYYREGVMKNEKKVEEEAAAAAAALAAKRKKEGKKASTSKSGGTNTTNTIAPDGGGGSSSSERNLATWVECHEDEKVETHCRTEFLDGRLTPTDVVVSEHDDDDDDDDDEDDNENDEGTTEEDTEEDGEENDQFTSMSDPGVVRTASLMDSKNTISAMALKSIYRGGTTEKTAAGGVGGSAAAGDSEATAELSFSLTISEDENDTGDNNNNNNNNEDEECDSTECDVGVSTTIRRSQSTASQSTTPTRSNDTSSIAMGGKKFVRHFSVGAYPAQTMSQSERKKKSLSSTSGGVNENKDDDFERPLIRLKYGDRVQVVSMDSRGWVKLARGYGYIRLENDKQLVKGERSPWSSSILDLPFLVPNIFYYFPSFHCLPAQSAEPATRHAKLRPCFTNYPSNAIVSSMNR
jgi:hypothetical protein